MKVLFVSSGNSKDGISPITLNQGESLKSQGVFIEYYSLKGKGIIGYFHNILPLRKRLKISNYDIVHAHYSLSSFVASLAGASPLIVSLMGTDVKASPFFKIFIKFFAKYIWKATIVKSNDMAESLGVKDVMVIPNGVNFNRFKPLDKIDCQKQLEWDYNKKHILFAANQDREEKNYKLAAGAIAILKDSNIIVHFLKDVPNKEVPLYYNAADVVLLTSLWEGSPNVIKEAMACNRPIVATDVGDIAEVILGSKGCFICKFNKNDLAKKIQQALAFNATDGRSNIENLNADRISNLIVSMYQSTLDNKNKN
ncbi:glycosyltransferase family 4 protein [Ulvibacter sp.]|nr:glycosyltransferase family 4 protein [Ulvibacter sp.]